MRQSNMCVTPIFKLKDDHFLALYAWDAGKNAGK